MGCLSNTQIQKVCLTDLQYGCVLPLRGATSAASYNQNAPVAEVQCAEWRPRALGRTACLKGGRKGKKGGHFSLCTHMQFVVPKVLYVCNPEADSPPSPAPFTEAGDL